MEKNPQNCRPFGEARDDADALRPTAVPMRIVAALNLGVYYAVAALLAGMSLFALLQILARSLYGVFGINLAVPWSEELGRSLMIWLIFLGAAYACRVGQMIALTFVADAVPACLQRVVDGVAALFSIGLYALLVSVGWKVSTFGWAELSPVLQFPKAYVYLAMPVGASMMIINTIALMADRGMFSRTYDRQAGTEVPAIGSSHE